MNARFGSVLPKNSDRGHVDIAANNKKLQISVDKINGLATIYLSGRFCIRAYSDFNETYKRVLNNPTIVSVVINLEKIEALDSSALGMLLLLRNDVQAANKSLALCAPSQVLANKLCIANFGKIFKIN